MALKTSSLVGSVVQSASFLRCKLSTTHYRSEDCHLKRPSHGRCNAPSKGGGLCARVGHQLRRDLVHEFTHPDRKRPVTFITLQCMIFQWLCCLSANSQWSIVMFRPRVANSRVEDSCCLLCQTHVARLVDFSCSRCKESD